MVSPCGNFSARVEGGVLTITSLSGGSVTYKINTILRDYIKDIRKTTLVWEIPSETQCTKLALATENVVAVFSTDKLWEPIIIEQSVSEGVERIQWVPPVTPDEPGAYQNCTQLVIWTKYNVEAKCYSLDCTRVLFVVPKPITTKLIVKKQLENRIWSILAEPYFGKDADSLTKAVADVNPIMYHFYNDGTVSKLLAKVRMPSNSLTEPQLSWSVSGKWLLLFNYIDPLFGFDLKVFNLLAVYKKPVQANAPIFEGDNLLHINWNTEGIENGVDGVDGVVLGGPAYFATWLSIDDTDYILVVSKYADLPIETVLISCETFKIIHRGQLASELSQGWVFRDGYKKTSARSYQNGSKLTGVCAYLDLIQFTFDDSVVFYKLSIPNLLWTFETCFGISDVVQSEQVKDHIFVLSNQRLVDYYEKNVSVVERGTRMQKAVFKDHEIVIETAREDKIVAFNYNKPSIKSVDDSNIVIMDKYQYREEDSRVVGLMNDVQSREWKSRIKRNRFSELISDDITDTFNLKRQRTSRS